MTICSPGSLWVCLQASLCQELLATVSLPLPDSTSTATSSATPIKSSADLDAERGAHRNCLGAVVAPLRQRGPSEEYLWVKNSEEHFWAEDARGGLELELEGKVEPSDWSWRA